MTKRILIVDDEAKVRQYYRIMLTSQIEDDLEIHEAAGAVEAIGVMADVPIDLILLDIRMPGVDGARLYAAMHSANRHIRVVVSSVFPRERQQTVIPDADEYFDKSEGFTSLKSKLEPLLV